MLKKIGKCINECKARFDLKIVLLAILLIFICVMQFIQNKKIENLYKYINISGKEQKQNFKRPFGKIDRRPRKEFIGKIRGEFFENLNQEMKEMDLIKQRIQNEMERYFDSNGSYVTIQGDNENNLRIEESFNKDKNEYVLLLYLPKTFTEKNVHAYVENGLLYVKITKDENLNNKNEKIKNSFSSLKISSLPATRATTKDIKKTFQNNIITIIVPIIK